MAFNSFDSDDTVRDKLFQWLFIFGVGPAAVILYVSGLSWFLLVSLFGFVKAFLCYVELEKRKEKLKASEQKKEADAKARKRKEKADAKAREKAKEERKKKREARRKSLIDKYGEQDGMMIFSGKISEDDYLWKKDLVKKYGKDTGEKIFNKELFIDMTKEMLIDAFGNPSDIKETVTREKITNKYYYHPRETRQSTTVYGLEVTLENDVVSGWKDLE